MNNNTGFGFIGGFLLGGVVGAAIALMMAPASGEETRDELRAEGLALKHRGQEFGDDQTRQAKKMVKHAQKDITKAQARVGDAIQERKDNMREAMGIGK